MTEAEAKHPVRKQKTKELVEDDSEVEGKRRRVETAEMDWRRIVESELKGIREEMKGMRVLLRNVESVVKVMKGMVEGMAVAPGDSDAVGEPDDTEMGSRTDADAVAKAVQEEEEEEEEDGMIE
jgi:predicted anti-sigma-YlaC factor YlaD